MVLLLLEMALNFTMLQSESLDRFRISSNIFLLVSHLKANIHFMVIFQARFQNKKPKKTHPVIQADAKRTLGQFWQSLLCTLVVWWINVSSEILLCLPSPEIFLFAAVSLLWGPRLCYSHSCLTGLCGLWMHSSHWSIWLWSWRKMEVNKAMEENPGF